MVTASHLWGSFLTFPAGRNGELCHLGKDTHHGLKEEEEKVKVEKADDEEKIKKDRWKGRRGKRRKNRGGEGEKEEQEEGREKREKEEEFEEEEEKKREKEKNIGKRRPRVERCSSFWEQSS